MEFNATFLASIVTFILFVFLMNKVLYTPILGIMEERKNFVDGNYEAAGENDSRSEELTNRKNGKLADARDNAKNKYFNIVQSFKSKKSETVQKAKNTVQEELEREKAGLEELSNTVKISLKGRLNDLADDISEKILGYRSKSTAFDDEAADRILWGKGK